MLLHHGQIWFKVPETILFKLNGQLPDHVMAKDIILRIIGDIGTEGGNYKCMQFSGEVIDHMNMEERLTLTNMTTEAGAKNGIIEPDSVTESYIRERTDSPFQRVLSDENADYSDIHEYEVNQMDPIVAKPFSPANTCAVRDVQGIEIDKAYIGSCTGAKLTDLRAASRLLKGKKVKARTEVIPAAQSIYISALREGLVDIFVDAGCVVGPPTCGACCGAHMGVLGPKEICISTTNRNFPGRMGDIESQTFLASPLVVAASAINGKITDPRDITT